MEEREPYEAYMRRRNLEEDTRELKWDNRFMELAKTISGWSKDPSSKIGAVAVNDERRILATGYNGFPKGIEDSQERLNDREQKYPLIVHAETNALMNALYAGVSLKNATMYVHGLPVCPDCTKLIIQAGIRRIVINKFVMNTPEKWVELWNSKSGPMFKEAGVLVTQLG
jgi:dCMP deaminase